MIRRAVAEYLSIQRGAFIFYVAKRRANDGRKQLKYEETSYENDQEVIYQRRHRANGARSRPCDLIPSINRHNLQHDKRTPSKIVKVDKSVHR
jgi:hypothetical protein